MPIISPKPVSSKAFIEASQNITKKFDLDGRKAEAMKAKEEKKAMRETMAFYEAAQRRSNNQTKYAAFSEAVKTRLLGYSICDIGNSAMCKINESLGHDVFKADDPTTFAAITYAFIHENGEASSILYNMQKGPMTVYLSELTNKIKSTHRSICESVDKDDPASLTVSDDVMNGYKQAADEMFGHEELVETIADRVAVAMTDFVNQNAEDKEKIIAALTATKDKVESLGPDASEELKESYANLGRKYVTNIREKKHGLFNEMVLSMAKSVIKSENAAVKEKFMEGAHLNMDAIVNSVATMYTFIETVNTMRLVKVDESFVKDMLGSILAD